MIQLTSKITDHEVALEAIVSLGGTPDLSSGHRLPPVCAGHLVLLDLINSPLLEVEEVPDGEEPPPIIYTCEDVQAAVLILVRGEKALHPILAAITDAPRIWARAVHESRQVVTAANWQSVGNQIMALIDTGRNGFEMIQETRGGGAGRIDMPWLSAMFVACDGLLTWRELCWETPFAAVGHIIAQRAKSLDAKVHRPIDIEAAMRQVVAEMKAEDEREQGGGDDVAEA